MARLTPRSSRGFAAAGGLCSAAVAILLAGCSDTTYGTGVNPGTQTIKDIAGIALIGGSKAPPIDYEPRAKVVAPPPGVAASLPPPAASDSAVADNGATPPNWPKDPDLAAAKFKADVAAREARGEAPAPLKLPPGMASQPEGPATTRSNRSGLIDTTQLSAEDSKKVRKAFADAKSSLAVDANGKPVRRYLTEPPAQYREPDPTQPVEFTEQKKKFHWWWQKQNDDSNLTPAATASTTPETPPSTN